MSSEQVWVKIEDIAILRLCECGKNTESVDSGAAVKGGVAGLAELCGQRVSKKAATAFSRHPSAVDCASGLDYSGGMADLFCRRGPCTHSKPQQGSVAGLRSV